MPVRLSMMFDGLMSPCTMPCRCRAARAFRQSRTIATATPAFIRGCAGPAVTITWLMYSQRRLLTRSRTRSSMFGTSSRARS